MRDDVSVRLIGFTRATFYSEIKNKIIQTRPYRAPEVILGLTFGASADIWSLGCLLCYLLTGKHIFIPTTNQKHLQSEEQLSFMLSYCQKISRTFLNSSPAKNRFFDENFRLKNFVIIEKKSFKKILRQKRNISETTVEKFAQLLDGCLKFSPQERDTAHEIIEKHIQWKNPYFCTKHLCSGNKFEHALGIGVSRGLDRRINYFRNEKGEALINFEGEFEDDNFKKPHKNPSTVVNQPFLTKPLSDLIQGYRHLNFNNDTKKINEKNPPSIFNLKGNTAAKLIEYMKRNPLKDEEYNVESEEIHKISENEIDEDPQDSEKDKIKSTSYSSHNKILSSKDVSDADMEDNIEGINEIKYPSR